MSEYRMAAEELARAAGAIQMARLHDEHTVDRKEGIQLVTEVDRACERLIVDALRERYPDHDICAEEGSGRASGSAHTWVVDPLDGTTNYAHGFPFFGVSIGLVREDSFIAGAVFDPVRDELFSAAAGEGATVNGSPLRVSATPSLGNALLATGFAYVDREGGRVGNMDHFEAFVKDARAVRRPGAAAIDLAYVACGRLDGFWEMNLKPWDMAAGALIITESGGTVSSFDGGAFDLYGTEILASNGRIHREMSKVLTR